MNAKDFENDDVSSASGPAVHDVCARYGVRYIYRGGDGSEYRLSGIDPRNSVLLHHRLSARFMPEKGTYGIRRWIFQNISALWVFMLFWMKMIRKKPKDANEAKALLNRCHPIWYPKHEMAQQIRRCVTGTGALVPIYDRDSIFDKLRGMLTRDEQAFLLEYSQPEALDVTNRLFATAQSMYDFVIKKVSSGQMHFDFASIACGSSRALLDVAVLVTRKLQALGQPVPTFSFHFVDKDPEALKSAMDTARQRGFGDNVTLYHTSASKFFQLCYEQNQTFDIVEMVGLADYLRNAHRVSYYRGCMGVVKGGGIFVVAHINKTWWSFSVHYRTGWPGLLRRRPEVLRNHLVKAGAKPSNITLETMPACGAHTVAVVHKN